MTQRWQDKLFIWFKRTGWRPADVEKNYPLARVDLTKFKKFDIQISLTNKLYSLLQYVLVVFVGLLFMMNVSNIPFMEQILLVAFVLYACFSAGMMLENHPIALHLEWLKLLFILVAIFSYPLANWIEWVLATVIVLNSATLLFKRKSLISSKAVATLVGEN